MVAVTGIGSGLDIEGLVSGLVNAERAPLEARFAKREAKATALISGFGALKSALSELKSGLAGVKNASIYTRMKATSTDADAVKVSASASASSGSYQVEVTKLATTQSFASATYASIDTVIGQGTLTFSFGQPTYTSDPELNADTSYSTFIPDPENEPVVITIDETNNTLDGIKNAINDSDAGVSASIIKDGDQYRLLMTTNDTGRSNSLAVSVVEDTDPTVAGLSDLDYNVGSANLIQTRAASDAEFTVNGFGVSSASNTVDDAIDGVTLTLRQVTEQTAVISVSEDRAGVTSAVNKFIDGYNGYIKTLGALTDYSQEANTRGPLQGDFSARSVSNRVRAELNFPTDGITGDYRTLAAIGITTNADGSLKLDSAKLNEALDADPAAVEALFADSTYDGNPVTGVASRLDAVVTDLLSKDGILESRTGTLQKQIERVSKDRESLSIRLEKIEARYRAQFNAMDSLLSSITTTGDFLSQQLANLPGYYDGKK